MSKADWVFSLKNDPRAVVRTLAEGIEASIFPGEHVMLSVVKLAPHSRGTSHSHPEEQWGVMLEGSCTRIQGDEAVEVKPGDFWHTPGGVTHTIVTGPEGAVLIDIFSPPREEYKKAGSGFGNAKIGQ